jgi:hypothetical protein
MSMDEKIVLCNCLECTSSMHHDYGACDGEARYYVELHMVDNCHLFEGGSSKALVCMECMDAFRISAQWFIREGMEGRRPPKCQGQSCDRFITRLHSFFDDVQNAASYLGDLVVKSEVH